MREWDNCNIFEHWLMFKNIEFSQNLNMKKISLAITLLFVNCLLDSCCKTEEYCFVVDSIQIRNFSVDEYKNLDSLVEIDANNYAISLGSKTLDAICWNNESFGGSLMAYYCEETYYRLKSKLFNISIKSNQALNSKYPAGSELKGLFRPISLVEECLKNAKTKEDCIQEYSEIPKANSLEDVFNESILPNDYIANLYASKANYTYINLLILNINESVNKNTHKITVRFEFEDGQILEAVTDGITIK